MTSQELPAIETHIVRKALDNLLYSSIRGGKPAHYIFCYGRALYAQIAGIDAHTLRPLYHAQH